MDFFVAVLFGSVAVFAVLTLMILPFVSRFKGMTPFDTVSRAIAGGICITGVLAALISVYVAGYNLVNVPSASFPFSAVLILCLLLLVITAGPAAVCVWVSAKWLLRPVGRKQQ